MNLSTSTIVVGGDAVISLSGEIDLATIPLLHDALTKALTHHPGRLMVIDLDGVTVLEDTGLGVLHGCGRLGTSDRRRSRRGVQQHAAARTARSNRVQQGHRSARSPEGEQ